MLTFTTDLYFNVMNRLKDRFPALHKQMLKTKLLWNGGFDKTVVPYLKFTTAFMDRETACCIMWRIRRTNQQKLIQIMLVDIKQKFANQGIEEKIIENIRKRYYRAEVRLPDDHSTGR